MNRTLLLLALSVMGCLLMTPDAHAQISARNFRNARAATRSFLYNRPTVSPYVNLANRNTGFGMPNYFTYVRPQLERQQRQMSQRRQTAQMQQQLNQVQSQVARSSQQATGMMLTGRQGWSARGGTRFGSYLNFYPGMYRIARR